MSLKISKLHNIPASGIYSDITSLISTFKCSRNPDSEMFLQKTAMRHESKDISRTYICVDTEKSKIIGYFTLAIKCINVGVLKDIDPKTFESMNADGGVSQAYLIGQLARADDSPKGLGRTMFDIAMAILFSMNETIGCHTVRVDCTDELVGYYTGYGFVTVGKNAKNNLNSMVLII
ncbi:MAG: hypothetical protein LBT41_02645 [Candidatus Methanoplasma sp.]|jgi:hypothetical protein|nr:hypothetical protein [Candidatus Methanoplasma sp.]